VVPAKRVVAVESHIRIPYAGYRHDQSALRTVYGKMHAFLEVLHLGESFPSHGEDEGFVSLPVAILRLKDEGEVVLGGLALKG